LYTSNELTLRTRKVREKLIVSQLVKNLPTIYGIGRFITVFTRARYYSLPCSRRMQPTHSQPISLRSILILSSQLRLCLSSYLLLFVFRLNICVHFSFTRHFRSPLRIEIVRMFLRCKVLFHIEHERAIFVHS